MIKVEELGFKNLDDMEFATAPECECGCGGSLSVVVDEKEEVGEVMASILGAFDCPSSGGMVINSNGICKMFFPTHLMKGGEYEQGVFGCMQAQTDEEYSKRDAINVFVNIVNDFDLHHVAILEEDPKNKGCYEIISMAS